MISRHSIWLNVILTIGIGRSKIMISQTKSDTAKAKNNSSVFTHLVIRLIADVHHAEKLPLQANMNEKANPPVQIPMIAIIPRYVTFGKFR